MAIGCAGMRPMVDLAGSLDTHANLLQVTAPAVADELAGAADLVKGKATGRPLALVRGLSDSVLPAGEHGPGARSLVRGVDDDLFGLGARDAVVAAVLRRDEQALAHFPQHIGADRDPFDGLVSSHPQVRLTCEADPDTPAGWLVRVEVRQDALPDGWLQAGRLLEKIDALAAANRLRPQPRTLEGAGASDWLTMARTRWFVA
jgi:F420-0:Gamma-glutamyl ligase